MDFIKKANEKAKSQPKIYLKVLKETIPKEQKQMKSNHRHKVARVIETMKSTQEALKKDPKAKLNHKQASTLMMLLYTKKVREQIIKETSMKKYQESMLYLFISLYNTSSFASKLLMRKAIKHGIKQLES